MTAPAVPQITIVDLQNVIKVIDTAAERGAFRGHELTAVGAVRDKVSSFLSAIPQEEKPVEEPVAETPPAVDMPKPAPRRRVKNGE